MVSITHLKQVMAVANLSEEGRQKLDALLKDVPATGVSILPVLPAEHPIMKLFNNGSRPFTVLSTEDMNALGEFVNYYTSAFSTNEVSMTPMLNVYNDAHDNLENKLTITRMPLDLSELQVLTKFGEIFECNVNIRPNTGALGGIAIEISKIVRTMEKAQERYLREIHSTTGGDMVF